MTVLADFATVNPKLQAVLKDEDVVSFVGMTDVSEGGHTTRGEDRPYSAVKKGYTPFMNGDLLVAKITPCFQNGKIAQAKLANEQGFGSTEFHVVRVDPAAADPRYLLHMMRVPHVRIEGEKRMTGSAGQKRVPKQFVESLEIPLPPLPEQRRIAAILDQADELRAKRRRALALLDELGESIFISMFGSAGTAAASGATRRLADVAQIKSGSTPDRKRSDFFGGGIPWVKTGEVAGEVIYVTEESVSAEGKKSARLQLFPAGSIVIAMYGQGKTRGQSAILGIEATVNQACAVILPSEYFSVEFMGQQLRMSYEALRAKAQGGNQANLNLGLVGDLDVLVPSKSDQDLFVRRAKLIGTLSSSQLSQLAELDELFDSLQHRAFRGGL